MSELNGNDTPNNMKIGNTMQSLFREKSLETVENPEQLNDYLKVTSPGVWIVLGAVIVILAGELSVGDVVYSIPLSETLDEGVYTGTLVTETLSPVSLFF